jgi:probable rRNA maturation factor
MAPLSVEIIEESSLWAPASNLRAVITKAVAGVATHPDTAAAVRGHDAVSVALIDDGSMARLNKRWRNKNTPTNVLSFPTPPSAKHVGQRMLGDIVLAFETIEREAVADGKTMNDHVAHLVTHAMLHLLGYEHEADRDAERMEALEINILATLGIADPYKIGAA